MPLAVECQNIRKTYPGQSEPALKDFSLSIPVGQKTGLIGANGSGKSTLLKLIMNFIRPDKGTIRVMGSEDLEARKRDLGYVPEHQQGLETFTPRELLMLAWRMAALPSAQASRRIAELLEFVELQDVQDELVEGFSKGMMQRLQIALAMLHDPPILLFDEPLSGLDPEGQAGIRQLLRRMPDRTILLATHNLQDIEDFCDVAVVLHQGRQIASIDLRKIEKEIYFIELGTNRLPPLDSFQHLKPVLQKEDRPFPIVRLDATARELQEFLQACQENSLPIRRIQSRSILEDLYLQYVQNQDTRIFS